MAYSTRLIMLGGVMVLGTGIMGYQALDIKMHYTLVSARITSADQDCYIENTKGDKVAEADSNKTAYIACSDAPEIAAEYGFGKDAIHTRTEFAYEYYSPVDGQIYSGTLNRTDAGKDMVPGRVISVYASDTDPAESRTINSNVFLDDTGV